MVASVGVAACVRTRAARPVAGDAGSAPTLCPWGGWQGQGARVGAWVSLSQGGLAAWQRSERGSCLPRSGPGGAGGKAACDTG